MWQCIEGVLKPPRRDTVSCCASGHNFGGSFCGTPSLHCHIVGEQWAVGLLQYTVTLLGSSA